MMLLFKKVMKTLHILTVSMDYLAGPDLGLGSCTDDKITCVTMLSRKL